MRKLEKANAKYTGNQTTTRKESAKRSRMVAKQGLWYLLPFYATWVFPVVTEITEMVTAQYYNPMVILVAFFLPFQGALNFIIYMRPRFIKYRKRHQNWNMCYIIYRTVRKSLCCIDKDEDDLFVSGVGGGTTSASLASRTSSQQQEEGDQAADRESVVAEYNRRVSMEENETNNDVDDDVVAKQRRKSSVTFLDGDGLNVEEEKMEEGVDMNVQA